MELFSDTFLPDGLADLWFATRSCPACLTGYLRRVESLGGSPHWRCEDCGRCWGAEHGRLRHVDPLGCPGCAATDKRACIALLRRDFPRFGLEASVELD
jgi:hypothetical protein